MNSYNTEDNDFSSICPQTHGFMSSLSPMDEHLGAQSCINSMQTKILTSERELSSAKQEPGRNKHSFVHKKCAIYDVFF